MTVEWLPDFAITLIGLAMGAALVLFVVDTSRQIALKEER